MTRCTEFALVGRRHQHVEAVAALEAAAVEVLLHREARAEQADARQTRPCDPRGRRVGDVQQRDVDGGLDLRRDLVHRVRAQHEEIRTRPLHRAGGVGEDLARLLPPPRMLQLLNLVEVHAVQCDLGRVQAAQAPADDPVDRPVVRDRRFPAHAADEADGLHVAFLPAATGRSRVSSGGILRPRAELSMRMPRRLARVSSFFALITQWAVMRR